jgi:hypothetical protein
MPASVAPTKRESAAEIAERLVAAMIENLRYNVGIDRTHRQSC